MWTRRFAAFAATALLASCASAPKTPMEAYLNRYAAAETVALNCPAYGGYGNVSAMRADAQANLAHARALGATEMDIKKARNRVNGNFFAAAALTNQWQACSALLNSIAWVGTSTPVIQPQKPAKKAG